MLPGSSAERAKLRELSRFHDTRLEPAIRALFPHIGKPGHRNEDVPPLWDLMAQRLMQAAPLLPSSDRTLTLADCGYAVSLAWIEHLTLHFGIKPCVGDDVQAYRARLLHHRAVAEELADYGPRLASWLAAK